MFLKIQRNKFYEVLSEKDIPQSLLVEEIYAKRYVIKAVGEAKLFFSVELLTNNNYWLMASPGVDKRIEESETMIDNWEKLVSAFHRWSHLLKEELSAPDLWAEAAKTAQLFAPTATPSDDKFTRAELAEVQGQLRVLQQGLATAALPEPARQQLIELTQTAAVKAEGLTKKDWQNWIIGGFIAAITNLMLNPTQASDVLKLVKAAFGGLFLH